MLAPPEGGFSVLRRTRASDPKRATRGRLCAFDVLPPIYSPSSAWPHTLPSQRHTMGALYDGRVDRVDFSDPGKIGTIGTVQLDEAFPITSTDRSHNTRFS